MRRRPLTWLVAGAIAVAGWVAAQPIRGAGGAAATRSVSQYIAWERELEIALVRHDGPTLDRLLDPDLQVRVMPHDPLGREAWLQSIRRTLPARLHGLSVQDTGDGGIASFLLDAPLANVSVRTVVDFWRNGKLVSRTESAAAGAPQAKGANIRE